MATYIKGGPNDLWIFPGCLEVGCINIPVIPQNHIHYIGEIPTKLTNRKFQTLHNYTTNTIAVYLNGLREKNITEISNREFEFTDDLVSTDEIMVDYIKIEV